MTDPMNTSERMVGVNERFAEHVTSQAFALTLTGAMVQALAYVVAGADRGEPFRSNDRAMAGLERRGLILHSVADEWKPGTTAAVWFHWEPTMAGRLVHALTQQAGLQPGGDADPLVEEMRRFQAIRAEAERASMADQERRHQEFMSSIRLKADAKAGPSQ